MATPVLMPKQGNTVESCVLLEWTRKEGEAIAAGEILCEAETDKATIEVESPTTGIVLRTFYGADDDVPVQKIIAIIGEAGEDISSLIAEATTEESTGNEDGGPAGGAAGSEVPMDVAEVPAAPATAGGAVSPRARNLATARGVDLSGVAGTGPAGRIIERDVSALMADREPLTPAAIAALVEQGHKAPLRGTGIGGRVVAGDLTAEAPREETVLSEKSRPAVGADFPGPARDEAVRGVRKITAARMMESLGRTAQLTHSLSADATALLAYRKRLKASGEDLGLAKISLNDMILFAVSRVIKGHPALNAHWLGDTVRFFERVHLGFAVDTPRGLLVPVIRNADLLSLKEISSEARRLATACREGKIDPEELTGATFTISNLGGFGIESFTPIINPPEVGILGVCGTRLRPVEVDGDVVFRQHMGLSLTYDHQAVDGAPASRFLVALGDALADFDLFLAG